MSVVVVVVVLAAALALVYVVEPLRRSRGRAVPVAEPSPLEEEKAAALAAILDLEEELEAGKLSREEYETLREDYERRAIDVIERLDRRGTDAPADDLLEEEIARARNRLCPACGRRPGVVPGCSTCGS